MSLLEESTIIDITQSNIVVIDGCTRLYDIVYPQFSQHFVLKRLLLTDLNRLVNDIPADAVVLGIYPEHYEQVISWIQDIRKLDGWAHIPLIPCLKESAETVFFQAGATDCWVYPIALDVMIERLKHHIQIAKKLNHYHQALTQYRKAYTDQSHLIEIATHDIQHPINDLLMIEALLQQYGETSPPMQDLLKDMNHALDAMQETLTDFLTALHLRGQMQFKLEVSPVAGVLLDIGLKYAMRASAKKIEVLVGQTQGTIYADTRRVTQIVENLVSNAVKYSPPDKEVHIWSMVAPEGTYINVRDWGAGIPLEERNRLFSEFGKLSTRPTGNENSVGLGLWVVKTLAEAMNGEVGAKFPLEGGSIFWVRLPSHPPA
ncbi:MAG: HAMP domain-containing sensor histidine kinase [bacterium]|nr:HAMP domain-containing sensor histidine kinase [bacterium]